MMSAFLFSSRRRHTRSKRDWSSDVCSSDLQIEQMHFRDFVAVARGVALLRLPRRICQNRQITGERGGVARKINDFSRPELGEMLGRLSAQSGPWRIQNHKLRPFFRLLQKLFCVFVMG